MTENTKSPGKPKKPNKTKPGRVLPTNRVAFGKQLDILRAYPAAVESSAGGKVTNTIVARIVGMVPTTMSTVNGFFVDVGLLERTDGGYLLPSEAVTAFSHAYTWKSETPGHKLAPLLADTWFAQALLPRLTFREMQESAALAALAEAAKASPDFKPQLTVLLNYLETAGLIVREDGLVKAVRHVAAPPPTPPVVQEPLAGGGATPPKVNPVVTSTADGVQFQISVRVDTKEIGTWTPDRISSFFGGIAQVLAAKSAMDKQNEESSD